MNQFWKTKTFSELAKEWAKKLADSGFLDVEDPKGNLSTKNSRTSAFATKECTEEFYSSLQQYLNTSEINERDRTILELYSSGTYIKHISEKSGWSGTTVKNVIRKHKNIFLKKN